MAKYKCKNPKCSNKDYQKQPGYCPECGDKLVKKSSNAIVYGILGVGVIFLLIVAIGVYALMTGVPVNDTLEEKTPTNKKTSTNTSDEKKSLTKDDIKNIVGWDLGDIQNITIKGSSVEIRYDLGFVNDNDDVIMKSSEKTIKVMPKLFKDKRINSVTLVSQEKTDDSYSPAVWITIKRSTAKTIDWDEINDQLTSDKGALLRVSDSYSIRPGVWDKLTIDIPMTSE